MDVFSPSKRREVMQAIRGKNTMPERLVRSMAHRLGLRFRLHGRNLPGRPDLVLAKHRTVIFVHGCFWHRHDCKLATTPKTRPEFWASKFQANVDRDRRNKALLQEQGWRVVEVWECETRDAEALELRLRQEFSVLPAPSLKE
uniref:Very short patch repair endonuclease n=1 Tax=Curvibacter symbiont subsp. Hydra magnipapillata TaxID=667019 RepID=C9YBX6_CURXX|nr:XorII very short patch repair endonuclease [Curvibacter putative symbiont of Hydra magnipapillata]